MDGRKEMVYQRMETRILTVKEAVLIRCLYYLLSVAVGAEKVSKKPVRRSNKYTFYRTVESKESFSISRHDVKIIMTIILVLREKFSLGFTRDCLSKREHRGTKSFQILHSRTFSFPLTLPFIGNLQLTKTHTLGGEETRRNLLQQVRRETLSWYTPAHKPNAFVANRDGNGAHSSCVRSRASRFSSLACIDCLVFSLE